MLDRILMGLTVVIGLVCALVVSYALLAPPAPLAPPPRRAETESKEAAEPSPAPRAFQPDQLLEFPYDPITDVHPTRPADAKTPPSDGESVIGIEVDGEARAYPLAMMAQPEAEVLNDTLGGVPLAVTWCLRCRNAMAFRRQVKNQTLTLFIPGMVWRGNMVMQDRETRTLWSQILGTGESGPLAESTLEPIPAVVTDWASWKSAHPATTVADLRRLAGGEAVDQRSSYGEAKMALFVLAFEHDDEAAIWALPALAKQPVVNDQVGKTSVLIAFEPASRTASLFNRELDGRVLTFRAGPEGALRDEPTGSTWQALTGRATEGPLAGRRLTRLPGFVVRRDAWMEFHPRTGAR